MGSELYDGDMNFVSTEQHIIAFISTVTLFPLGSKLLNLHCQKVDVGPNLKQTEHQMTKVRTWWPQSY